MREISTARRYAAALFENAKKSDSVAKAGDDLRLVAEVVSRLPRLKLVLAQPLVTETRKKEALKDTFGDNIAPSTMAFLNLLVDKRRINLLPEVEQEFGRRALAHRNVAYATAISAVPMTPEQTEALRQSLEGRTGMGIELETDIDPRLIGGVLVRIGDTVWDGTVKGKLERLREQLLTFR